MEKLEAVAIIRGLNVKIPPSSPEYYHKVIEAYKILGRWMDVDTYEKNYDFVIAIKEGCVSEHSAE